jgi:formate hydrogenlyase subunit 4
MYAGLSADSWMEAGPAMALISVAFLIILVAENARIPVDDPNTHLELTMIHEVMVLDHSGPDFAFILYGSAMKLWTFGCLLIGVLMPFRTSYLILDIAVFIGGLMLLAVLIGMIESGMARLRLIRVPQLLVGASVLSTLAVILAFLRPEIGR